MSIRLCNDKILVRFIEKLPDGKKVEGTDITIHYPDEKLGQESDVYVKARVEAVGPGKWAQRDGHALDYRIPVGVQPGEVVLIVWWLREVQTNLALRAVLGDDKLVVTEGDILCVIDDEESGDED